eukprot:TRINITY_DN3685_c0_g1_i5.p1 TRINITY_DN3685_c0_g1~~TRINITY_DN3685_c0_g1_i5.p1  ORF type:complete len:771 (-),score=51.98 TRINITY_DN3685_c0_g1_i5:317-2455(-)
MENKKGYIKNNHLSEVAICVLVKDEHLDILEWIEYHQYIGIGKIYIYDNNSKPPMINMLRGLLEQGIVEYQYINDTYMVDDYFLYSKMKQFQRLNHVNRTKELMNSLQVWSLTNCVRTYHKRHKWIALIDVDEFFIFENSDPVQNRPNLPRFLDSYTNYGGLLVYRKSIGSSGHVDRPDQGVLASYTSCPGSIAAELRQAYPKVILNTNYFLTTGQCRIHECSSTKRMVNTRKKEQKIRWFLDYTNELPTWHKLYIHHYAIKSLEDFHKKQDRGMPHSRSTNNDEDQSRPYDFFEDLVNRTTHSCETAVQFSKVQGKSFCFLLQIYGRFQKHKMIQQKGMLNTKVVITWRQIDPEKLRQLVYQYGGSKQVCEDKQWGAIATQLGVPDTITNKSYKIKKIYVEKLLAREKEEQPQLAMPESMIALSQQVNLAQLEFGAKRKRRQSQLETVNVGESCEGQNFTTHLEANEVHVQAKGQKPTQDFQNKKQSMEMDHSKAILHQQSLSQDGEISMQDRKETNLGEEEHPVTGYITREKETSLLQDTSLEFKTRPISQYLFNETTNPTTPKQVSVPERLEQLQKDVQYLEQKHYNDITEQDKQGFFPLPPSSCSQIQPQRLLNFHRDHQMQKLEEILQQIIGNYGTFTMNWKLNEIGNQYQLLLNRVDKIQRLLEVQFNIANQEIESVRGLIQEQQQNLKNIEDELLSNDLRNQNNR